MFFRETAVVVDERTERESEVDAERVGRSVMETVIFYQPNSEWF